MTNLIPITMAYLAWADEGREVDFIYLDFCKAFDTESHTILIGKLREYGFGEGTVRWTENWLKDRAVTQAQSILQYIL